MLKGDSYKKKTCNSKNRFSEHLNLHNTSHWMLVKFHALSRCIFCFQDIGAQIMYNVDCLSLRVIFPLSHALATKLFPYIFYLIYLFNEYLYRMRTSACMYI